MRAGDATSLLSSAAPLFGALPAAGRLSYYAGGQVVGKWTNHTMEAPAGYQGAMSLRSYVPVPGDNHAFALGYINMPDITVGCPVLERRRRQQHLEDH